MRDVNFFVLTFLPTLLVGRYWTLWDADYVDLYCVRSNCYTTGATSTVPARVNAAVVALTVTIDVKC